MDWVWAGAVIGLAYVLAQMLPVWFLPDCTSDTADYDAILRACYEPMIKALMTQEPPP